MRRAKIPLRIAAAGLSALLLLSAQPAAAKPHYKRQAREQIEALEGQWRDAEISNNVSVMDKLLSDDYLGITPHGDVLTKEQQLDRMQSRQLVINSFEATDTKIKLVGQVAIVTSLAEVTGRSDHGELSGSYRYTRIYRHLANGAWKITNFEMTPVRGDVTHT